MFFEVVDANDARKNVKIFEENRIENARKFFQEEYTDIGKVVLGAIYEASVKGEVFTRINTEEIFSKYPDDIATKTVENLIILGFRVNDHRLFNTVTLYVTSKTKEIRVSF